MEKPIVKVDLQGPDGNVFTLMRAARAAMLAAVPRGGNPTERRWKREHAEGDASEMMKAVMQSHSYDEALKIIGQYVTIRRKEVGYEVT
ncbi:hypothetical protein [Alistipes sp.]|uniref:hypothetical protein n=1 Tax=Alistipes sp. TaxID=1872444 RepID=UPI003AEFEE7E